MSNSIVSKGKDVFEAIDIGLSILGVTKEEVSIEIIQQQKKGILAFGSKRAVVKLTIEEKGNVLQENEERTKGAGNPKPAMEFDNIDAFIDNLVIDEDNGVKELVSDTSIVTEQPSSYNLSNADEGKVWVKNGRIYSMPSDNKYPTVQAGKGIQLYKNGQLVQGKVIITEYDDYELVSGTEEADTKWDVTLDTTKTTVTLHIEPGYKKVWKALDIAPAEHILIEAEEIKTVNNKITFEDISQRLNRLGVTYGVDYNEIMAATEAMDVGNFIIASGIKPTDGKHGRLELKVELESSDGPVEQLDGTVNYREIKRIPTVIEGQVIGYIHPPIPGGPGKTVTDETILPAEVKPLKVQVGKGIELINGESTIVATDSGRPEISQRGTFVKVSVLPKYIHAGDLDISTGNIHFSGDVDILGDVQDGMLIEAEGDIFVNKNVNMSTLTSNNSISIGKNVISCTLSAGKNNILIAEIGHLLAIIQKQMESVILSIKQLHRLPSFHTSDLNKGGLRPLIKILLEKKFGSFADNIKHVTAIIQRGKSYLDREWIEVGEKLNRCFLSSIPNEYNDVESIELFLMEIKELYKISETPVEPNSFISLLYCVNSTIYSSGDVNVYGQGSYNSKIHAGGKLQINGNLRGGEVYARMGAEISETGSVAGVPTAISVPADQKIYIKNAREGTTIKIGKVKHVFFNDKENVTARLNEKENKIEIL